MSFLLNPHVFGVAATAFEAVHTGQGVQAAGGTFAAFTDIPCTVGEQLVCVVYYGSTQGAGRAAAGWTNAYQANFSVGTIVVFTKIAASTLESIAPNCNSSGSGPYQFYRLSNADTVLVAGANNGAGNQPDSPSLATGVSRAYVFLSFGFNFGEPGGGVTLPTTAPVGYSGLTSNRTTYYGMASARRALTAATEDPGAFAGAAVTYGAAGVTIAVGKA